MFGLEKYYWDRMFFGNVQDEPLMNFLAMSKKTLVLD